MPRTLTRVCLLICVAAATLYLALTAAPVSAGDLSGRWGVGLEGGFNKLVGGDKDYSNVDHSMAFWVGHGLASNWNLALAFRYANVRPGVDEPGQSAGWTTESKSGFLTEMLHPQLKAQYRLAPDSRWSPWAGAGIGWMRWRVIDMQTADDSLFPDGTSVIGYDKDGNQSTLSDDNVTLDFELGLDFFVTDSFTLFIAGRYHAILGNKLDNVGLSAIWGPDDVDANSGAVEGVFGLSLWFGSKDHDGDGIVNELDICPREREDFDGFEDQDGCPDTDNDNDGIVDAQDQCPDDPEDFDGFLDEDGCPDLDNDGDGIPDAQDDCPEEAEDLDGFLDEDGCADLDNDGDGVPDAQDQCPDTGVYVTVDENGCPLASPIADNLVLEGVGFRTGSAELTAASQEVLARLAESLRAYSDVRIEVRGHTDNTGAAEFNLSLSQRRALAVREALIRQGVAADRVTAIGYGEDYPVASNATSAGREQNRRVEIVRIDR